MRGAVLYGPRDVRIDDRPDPRIVDPTDAVIRLSATCICGSDLHLVDGFIPFMKPGDILGHEPMGIVEEVGPEVEHLRPGDRVVVPFNISCGHCFMCDRALYAHCETTQVREHGKGDKEIYLVHNRLGEPCARCGGALARVDYEEHTVYYCPSCQTGGRVLKDRRLSRLLK